MKRRVREVMVCNLHPFVRMDRLQHALAVGLVPLLVAFLLSMACSGCSGELADEGTLRIESPLNGAVVPSASVRVTGIARLVGAEEVDINGRLVPVQPDGTFSVTLSLGEGVHRIVASAPTHIHQVAIRVDTVPPVVVLDEPPAGSAVQGEVVSVRGHVEDAGPVTVTLAGQPVAVDEDGGFAFERTVPAGAHRWRVLAQDEAGHRAGAYTAFLAGQYAPLGRALVDAVVLSVKNEGLAVAAQAAAQFLNAEELTARLKDLNPIVRTTGVKIKVRDLRYDDLTVAFETGTGVLTARFEVSNLVVDAEADTVIHDEDFSLRATEVELTATLGLSSENGGLVVTVEESDATIRGFELGGLPSIIEDSASLRSRIQRVIEEELEKEIADHLPEALRALLADTGGTQVIEIGSVSLNLGLELGAMDVTPEGIHSRIHANVTSPDAAPGRLAQVPGSLVTAHPTPASEAPLSAVLDLDLLNAVLFGAWTTNALNFDLGPIASVGALSLAVPSVRDVAMSDSPLLLTVSVELPPVIQGTGQALELFMPDVRVQVFAQEAAQRLALLTISLGVRAEARFVTENGAVRLSILAPELSADPVVGPEDLPLGEELDRFSQQFFARSVAEELEALQFEIPAIEGFRLDDPTAQFADGHLLIESSLNFGP